MSQGRVLLPSPITFVFPSYYHSASCLFPLTLASSYITPPPLLFCIAVKVTARLMYS